MLNQVVLVGRLTKNIELKTTKQHKVSNIILAVPRSYKNDNGEYDTDFIECTLWDSVAENTFNYCRKGDLIGIKGRIENKQIIAERITFLSNKKIEDDKEENK